MIAPTSPAKITTGLMSVSSTMPPEIVFATWTERKARSGSGNRQPAIATATLGRSAPVAIDVAIALAVSWKPFREIEDQRSYHHNDDDQRYFHEPCPSIGRQEPGRGDQPGSPR